MLQGKGGVGKSLVASYLAQFLADEGRLSACYDTDPVNQSFRAIGALNVRPIELLTDADLNVAGVDRLIEEILSAKQDVVIDNGAASFLPLSRYLLANGIPDVLAERNVSMVLHTIVTGGSSGVDTLAGLEALANDFATVKVVVWVNEFFGPAQYDGTGFEATRVYMNQKDRLRGPIYLRKLDPVMFAPNLATMLERHMTFDEAAKSDEFMIMQKSRLHRIKGDIWGQMQAVI